MIGDLRFYSASAEARCQRRRWLNGIGVGSKLVGGSPAGAELQEFLIDTAPNTVLQLEDGSSCRPPTGCSPLSGIEINTVEAFWVRDPTAWQFNPSTRCQKRGASGSSGRLACAAPVRFPSAGGERVLFSARMPGIHFWDSGTD